MTRTRSITLPPEHLEPELVRPLPSQPPTRLGGNLQSERSLDPYHQIFRGPEFTSPVSIDEARTVAAENGLRLPAAYRTRTPVSVLDLLRSPRRDAVLKLLGPLVSYGVVTNNQAAAFTGERAYADPRSSLVADLFRSGLIAMSPPYLDFGIASVGHGAAVYKLTSYQRVQEIRDDLSYSEWLAVTGGQPLPTAAVNVRHDALAAELALRAAASKRVSAVLGPHFSTFTNLLTGQRTNTRLAGGPDLTLVRPDGVRIAIELTATVGRGFTQKIDTWAKYLHADPFNHSGLVVIFLAAPRIEDLRRRGDWPRRDLYRAVASATKRYEGLVGDRTADRMGVATWREWFPGALQASDRFDHLMADRPTGRDPLWESAAFLDSHAVPTVSGDRGRLRAIITNAPMLAQTPPNLRQHRSVGDLNADVVKDVEHPLRTIAPLRRNSATRAVGAGQGAAGDTYLPDRLLGPLRGERTPRQLVRSSPRHPSEWARQVARRPRVLAEEDGSV